jgi:hypothetical protein
MIGQGAGRMPAPGLEAAAARPCAGLLEDQRHENALVQRRIGGDGADVVGAHHFIVFMLDDVAVPDKETRYVKAGADARDLARIGDDRILPAALAGIWRPPLPPAWEIEVAVGMPTLCPLPVARQWALVPQGTPPFPPPLP